MLVTVLFVTQLSLHRITVYKKCYTLFDVCDISGMVFSNFLLNECLFYQFPVPLSWNRHYNLRLLAAYRSLSADLLVKEHLTCLNSLWDDIGDVLEACKDGVHLITSLLHLTAHHWRWRLRVACFFISSTQLKYRHVVFQWVQIAVVREDVKWRCSSTAYVVSVCHEATGQCGMTQVSAGCWWRSRVSRITRQFARRPYATRCLQATHSLFYTQTTHVTVNRQLLTIRKCDN